ncbi:MAG: FAD-dependent oxidoreductase [Deltaproteobacteria bacterium]|nr:FAD-dependent oxidoreductase [Deltaproteobacteria bacterium]
MSQAVLTIDGAQVAAPSGVSLLEATRSAGIYIPGLCSHPDLPPACGKVGLPAIWRGGQIVQGTSESVEFDGCGLCLVEADGELVQACVTSAREGLQVLSETPKVKAKRQDRLAEILADHPHACLICPNRDGCDRIACSFNVPVPERCCSKFSNCELRRLADYIGIKPDTPRYIPRGLPILRDDPLFTRDYNLCVGCTRCVRVCSDVRGVGALGFTVTDGRLEVGSVAPFLPESECKFCLACVGVCPTGALMDKAADIAVGASKEQSLVPCRAACPAGIDIPRYVRLIGQGRYDEAVSVIRERAPFPGILGYVCFHPCENVCRRGKVNEPIAICSLKRFAAEQIPPLDPAAARAEASSGKRVAIVGSGPAGLTAAYYLRGKGHGVTVFEAGSKPGGMLRHGIPRYRVPREVVEREIEEVLARGVELRTNTSVGSGADFSLEKLRAEYDAVFLGVGAQLSKKIKLDGSELNGVLWGLDFLRDVNLGSWPGTPLGRVVVVGGGNVAIDVALTARRLGAKEIQIACLESRAEMPAFEWEIEQALEEGAVIHPSWGPKRIVGNGKVIGVELVRCTRVFDESGRFNPSFDPSVTTAIEADTVILAIGQSTDFSFLGENGQELRTQRGTIQADDTLLATPVKGLFAGGEVVSGPSSVIQAIASGRKAAASIDRYLGGDGVFAQSTEEESDPWIGRDGNFASWRRVAMPQLSLSERQASFDPIELGFDEAMALSEAKRCLRCNLRLELNAPVLPPESWLEFNPERVAGVPEVEGVYQLLGEGKQILRIAGTADLRQALEEQLRSQPKARYFLYEEARMYTQRESELLQHFLQEHGRLPSGNELGDDLF